MTKQDHDSDVSFIKALAELLRDNDLTELEVMREYGDDDSLNVRISRGQPAAAPVAAPAAQCAGRRPRRQRQAPPPRPTRRLRRRSRTPPATPAR